MKSKSAVFLFLIIFISYANAQDCVLVHGWLNTGNVWNDTGVKNLLQNQYQFNRILQPTLGGTNSASDQSLNLKDYLITNSVNNSLVLSYSMGGMTTRYHMKRQFEQAQNRRINYHFTIGSPHLGANLANNSGEAIARILLTCEAALYPNGFLSETNEEGLKINATYFDAGNYASILLGSSLFNQMIHHEGGSALDDLQTGSSAVQYIDHPNTNYENNVAKVGIAGIENWPQVYRYAASSFDASADEVLQCVSYVESYRIAIMSNAFLDYLNQPTPQSLENMAESFATYAVFHEFPKAWNVLVTGNENGESDGIVAKTSQIYPNYNRQYYAPNTNHRNALNSDKVLESLSKAITVYELGSTNTIHVPYDSPTITEAISIATIGQTVAVTTSQALTGNIVVPSGITLKVKSGVIVDFNGHTLTSTGGTISIESGGIISLNSSTCVEGGSGAVSYNLNGATVSSNFSGIGEQIEAIPPTGYIFVRWNDGNTDNPRTIMSTAQMSLYAIYKAHLQSSSSVPLGTGTQRRIIKTVREQENEYNMYYESGNALWLTKSTNDGNTWNPETFVRELTGEGTVERELKFLTDSSGAFALHVSDLLTDLGGGIFNHSLRLHLDNTDIAGIDNFEASNSFYPSPVAVMTKPNASPYMPSIVVSLSKQPNSGFRFGIGISPYDYFNWSSATLSQGANANNITLQAVTGTGPTGALGWLIYVVWDEPGTSGGIQYMLGFLPKNPEHWHPLTSDITWYGPVTIASNGDNNKNPVLGVDAEGKASIAWEYRNGSMGSIKIDKRDINSTLSSLATKEYSDCATANNYPTSLSFSPSVSQFNLQTANPLTTNNIFTLSWYVPTKGIIAAQYYSNTGWESANVVNSSGTVPFTSDQVAGSTSKELAYVSQSGSLYALQMSALPTYTQLPTTVSLASPASGATGQATSVMLSWDCVVGATSYHLQVDNENTFAAPLVSDQGTVTGTSGNVSGLANNTTYYWRVKATNSSGDGSYSSVRSFTTALPPPATPANFHLSGTRFGCGNGGGEQSMVPAGGEENMLLIGGDEGGGVILNSGEPPTCTYYTLLTWNQCPESNGDHIDIYRGTQTNNMTLLNTTPYTNTTYLDCDACYGGMPVAYYYKIRAVSASGTSDFTTILNNGYSKRGVDNTSQNTAPLHFGLDQNTPNPFNPTTTISYQLPNDSYVTLKVYNTLGKEVALLVNEMQDAGYKYVTFDANSLPSGVYFYHIMAAPSAGSGQPFSDIKKMMLVK